VRFGEYKFMAVTEQDVPNDYIEGGFSGSATTMAYGALYNLYLDPKETHNYMIRKLPYITLYERAAARHLATFKAFPPKRIVDVPSQH
jgi:arylsulfatase